MASQFSKRQKKSVPEDQVVTSASEQEDPAPEYNQKALDIFTSNGGKTYAVAQISYNPVTGDAKVDEVFNVTRTVALAYQNQKIALGILKKIK